MPPPLELELVNDSQSDTSDVTETQNFLESLSLQDREQHFKRHFIKKVEPLSHLSRPDLCAIFPTFEAEIIEAYLLYTTFTVKVWANYDASAKKFHIDRRFDDCGKSIITPKKLNDLREMDPDTLEFGRVCFEVGTPFTTLRSVKLRVCPSKLKVGGAVRTSLSYPIGMEHTDHEEFFDFVEHVCKAIEAESLLYGQRGLQVDDIVRFAEMFRRWPTQRDIVIIQRQSSWYYDGPWIGVHSDDEYIDNRTEPKAGLLICRFGCDGCNCEEDRVRSYARRYLE